MHGMKNLKFPELCVANNYTYLTDLFCLFFPSWTESPREPRAHFQRFVITLRRGLHNALYTLVTSDFTSSNSLATKSVIAKAQSVQLYSPLTG